MSTATLIAALTGRIIDARTPTDPDLVECALPNALDMSPMSDQLEEISLRKIADGTQD